MQTPRRTPDLVAPAARRALCALCALCVLFTGCETSRETTPAGIDLAVARAMQPVRAWRASAGGRALGTVVLYEASVDPDAPTGRYYSVRNGFQQELGTIDAQGRAWRFVPHQREAVWVATGTLAAGVAAILDEDGARAADATAGPPANQPATAPASPPAEVELSEVPLDSLQPTEGR